MVSQRDENSLRDSEQRLSRSPLGQTREEPIIVIWAVGDSSSSWGDSEKWLNSGCILKSERKKKKELGRALWSGREGI